MKHNQKTSIEPINASSSRFGVQYENQFVVLDDGKHVIGMDATDLKNLIFENLKNGKADKFRLSKSSDYYNTTLLYDEDTGLLYTGGTNGRLYKYKVNKTKKIL